MARTPVGKREIQTVGEYLEGLAASRALERRIMARAKALERQLMSDAELLRERLRREKDEFRLRRVEAAYLYCVQRLAAIRRAQALARHSTGQLDRMLPPDARRRR